jgi:hypothetical protein
VRKSVRVAHTGVFAFSEGAAGTAITVTLNVPGTLVQPLLVAVTEYMPVATLEAPVITGDWEEEVKPDGPVHE